MSKAYILIRALVKTDAPDGTPVNEQATALRDEVHSNLESVGEEVLCCLAGVPPRDSIAKLDEDRDSYTLEAVEKIANGSLDIRPTRGILRAAVEDRDFWMRKFVDANDDIATWINKAPISDIAAGTLAQSYQAFIRHHEALMKVLEQHALIGPVPRGVLCSANLMADAAVKDEQFNPSLVHDPRD